jgi:hypothetical protein
MSDSPLKLAHIEEYRKQKAESGPRLTIDANCSSEYYYVRLEGDTPSRSGMACYVGQIRVEKHWPFLRWRLKLAKRRLLKTYKIICEMES